MRRGKSSFEKLRGAHDQWIDQEQGNKDTSIIQLYSRESKAQRERRSKIVEIQKKARRKDECNHKLLGLQARATENRKNSPAKAAFNIVRLPPIESPIKATRSRGLRRRTGVKESNEHFLPDIDATNNLRDVNLVADQQHVKPSRDPRFQRLISVLLTSEEYFGDLQRFAPPGKETNRRTRVGLGF